MKKYKTNITDEALLDMESIYDYIADSLHSPDNAMGQYNRIAEAILKLKSFPKRFPLFDFEPERSLGMRKMIVDNYLVCFIVDEDNAVVTVTDVLYGASNIKGRLADRHS